MKILWLCNLIIPQASEELGIQGIPKEGWVEGLLSAMSEKLSGHTLAIAFPVPENLDGRSGSFKLCGEDGPEVFYYAFSEDTVHPEVYDQALESSMNRILDEYRPDVVHVFGTEYPHALAMSKAATGEDFHYHPGRGRLLVTFQGVCSAIAADYMACLPEKVITSSTFRDTVKRDSIRQQQEKFRLRAASELETVKRAGYLGGRTSFDKKWAERLSPDAKYRFAGEVMRQTFYEPAGKDCVRDPNVIFVTGADYPLKGFHILLNALRDLNWPELKIRVAGQDIVTADTLERKVKISEYGKYLGELIENCGLSGKVTFLGRITAEQMKEEYLKCGMYVCPSVIENSPNSIVEAALLGAPVIAAAVGGIPDVLEDGTQALMYECSSRKPLEEVAANLKKCIETMLADPEAARKRADEARKRVLEDHAPETVCEQIFDIYSEMNGTDS
ncbi:MAG: glycosyltransferase family 4 protein [Lachnospiraceae bacterium]|nr:glycosyltransferase family 4 protein [Lachnospiraceae bacterium]